MELKVSIKAWALKEAFTISRNSKTEANTIVVTIEDGVFSGEGECVPYGRYGETVASVSAQINSVSKRIQDSLSREELIHILPAGAARNAIDCALWDLEAKKKNTTIWNLVGISDAMPKQTAFTIVLDTPEKMASRIARMSSEYSLFKVKLGGEDDIKCLQKIREAAPNSTIIVDANEGWDKDNLEQMVRACEDYKVALIEQPLPANDDEALLSLSTSIKICADESIHTSEDLDNLHGKYTAVNIKLDKTGGLTEGLELTRKAREQGFTVMVGCMVSTSLSIAPATVIAQYADYVDLDGPLLLAKDQKNALNYREGNVFPTTSEIWG